MLRSCYYARRFDEKNRFGEKLAQLRLRLNRLLSSFFVKMLHLYYCARRFDEKKIGGELRLKHNRLLLSFFVKMLRLSLYKIYFHKKMVAVKIDQNYNYLVDRTIPEIFCTNSICFSIASSRYVKSFG